MVFIIHGHLDPHQGKSLQKEDEEASSTLGCGVGAGSSYLSGRASQSCLGEVLFLFV